MDIKSFEPLWDCWYVKECLGEGSFGRVYRIERTEFDNTYVAALKHIRIPQSQSEIKSIMADGMDEASIETYYEKIVKDIVKEFELMSKLKGNSHVVSYEDHKCVRAQDRISWDIFIRMELLTSLIDYIQSRTITKKDIIKLGIDICKALELCQKHNIIHRDIKPENIFVSENGDFKLGDFGIARQIEATVADMSKKGTYTYIAPEVYKGEEYGTTVDIYSLGIVMYRLLNNNRTPFMPPYPEVISHMDREMSIVKRMSGQPLPPPVNSTGRLTEIVLKACAFDPKDRYHSPLVMRADLEAILYDSAEARFIYPEGDTADIKSVRYLGTEEEKTGTLNTGTGIENARTELMPGEAAYKRDTSGSEVMKGKSSGPVELLKRHKLQATILAAACLGAVGIGLAVVGDSEPAVNPEDETAVTKQTIEMTTEVTTEGTTEALTQATTQAQVTTQATTQPVTEAVTQPVTTQVVTAAPQPVTKAPVTQPVTRAPAPQPVTQAPVQQTQPVTQAPAPEPVTQAPVQQVEVATQPVTQAPVQTTEPIIDTNEAPPIVIGFD